MTLALISTLLFSQLIFAAQCPVGEHWVRAHHQSAYTRLDGTAVSGSNKSAHCQHNPESYRIWGESFKPGLPKDWPNKNERPRPWQEDEKERILEVISKLPVPYKSFLNIGMYRAIKSKTTGNPGSSLEKAITLYDDAFANDKLLQRTLLHELAHEEYLKMTDIDRTFSNIAVGWKYKREEPIYDGRKSVAEDSENSPGEAYANAIEYYFTEPTRLKFKDPNLYDWMSIKFKDIIKK